MFRLKWQHCSIYAAGLPGELPSNTGSSAFINWTVDQALQTLIVQERNPNNLTMTDSKTGFQTNLAAKHPNSQAQDIS